MSELGRLPKNLREARESLPDAEIEKIKFLYEGDYRDYLKQVSRREWGLRLQGMAIAAPTIIVTMLVFQYLFGH